jgi:hypothetical protein
MISLIQPLSVGNAVRVIITPASNAVIYWRLLRRTSNAFTGPDDQGAVVVADNTADNMILDAVALVNGTQYFYLDYGWDGTEWIAGTVYTATPATSYQDDGVDPLTIVEGRLSLGLAAQVAAGALSPASGAIQVTTAPFGNPDGVVFPTVSVHVDSVNPIHRALGEEILPDVSFSDGTWPGSEGWFARTTLRISAFSFNGDERNALRRAIRGIIQANLSVFDDACLTENEFSQTDNEDFQSFAAPAYMTVAMFSCTSPAFVQGVVQPITDVTVTATTYQEAPYV